MVPEMLGCREPSGYRQHSMYHVFSHTIMHANDETYII